MSCTFKFMEVTGTASNRWHRTEDRAAGRRDKTFVVTPLHLLFISDILFQETSCKGTFEHGCLRLTHR
jgi:hypothetical protein